MATQKCAICGAEVNLLQQQKLIDGSYICRKNCKKIGLKPLDYVHSTLDDVKAHNAQVEKGTKIWNELLAPDKKERKSMTRFGPNVYVSEKTGLMAYVETRYKFIVFGKSEHVAVYRIADLYDYTLSKKTVMVDGKPKTDSFIEYSFVDTPGMANFDQPVSGEKEYTKIKKYYDTFFGIQDTIGNFINKGKAQAEAIKATVNAAKALKDGGDGEAEAGAAADAVEKMLKGDRTKWIELANKSLSPYGGTTF